MRPTVRLQEAFANEGVDFCVMEQDLDAAEAIAATRAIETHSVCCGRDLFAHFDTENRSYAA
jgi:hypothetical protein